MKQGRRKRTQKWYLENEKKVMAKYGFKPQPGSGNGDKFKEDGENEYSLTQLKSTDKSQYIFKLYDWDKLQEHAKNKIPIFITEFIDRETFFTINADDIHKFAELVLKGGFKKDAYNLDDNIDFKPKTIKSSNHNNHDKKEKEGLEAIFERRNNKSDNGYRKRTFK